MRGKGLITFFAVALILICIYQLSFNLVTYRVEKRAVEYAQATILKGAPADNLTETQELEIKKVRERYLDSISNTPILNILIKKFTYQDCKDQQLGLGLDLQGGMNVTLQVSIDELIRALADKSDDPGFNRAMEMAKQKQRAQPQADLVTLFQQSWDEVVPNGKLASVFATRNNQDRIKLTSTNEEVIQFIREEATGAFDRTFNILSSRINKFGVTQPNITAQANTGRIVVELPGVDNPVRVRKLLQATAVLEFWETFDNRQFYPYLEAANVALRNRLSPIDTTGKADTTNLLASGTEEANPLLQSDSASVAGDSLSAIALGDSTDIFNPDTSQSAAQADAQKENPLFTVLTPSYYRDEGDQIQLSPGPVVGLALGTDTAKVNEYLSMDFVRAGLPRDAKLLWSAKPVQEGSNVYHLFAVQKQPGKDEAPIEGDKVIRASQDIDPNGKIEVQMTMSNEGAKIWRNLTKKQLNKYGSNENGAIAIVLDNYIYSAPFVNTEIPNGQSSITGGFTIEEAKDLANILQAGKLPAPARIIAEDVVGPSLGEASIRAGLTSIFVALIAIIAFMVLYYNTSGIIADICLLFNLMFIMGVLASLGATLTLSGIAGIVLTMGMAVDANVLIHERIKEELGKGKSMLKAIEEGHSKSWSAILDSNVTSLITGVILFYFGLGPVLGYATTLNIGIVLTVFTAVFMGHIFFNFALKHNIPLKFSTVISKNNFTNRNLQFIKSRKITYVISGIVCTIMLASILLKGFTYGVDFTGGRTYIVKFGQPVNTNEIRDVLQAKFGTAPVVKTYGSSNQVSITSSYLIENNSTEGDSLVNLAMYEGLAAQLPPGTSIEDFNSKYLQRSQVVGPSISQDIKNSAVKAVIFGFLGIFLYILLRFRKWQFATGTLIALGHDILILMGLFSVFTGLLPFSVDVDETFIATVLTVMGYSVNDKVVVFDRVREFLREHVKGDVRYVINEALNATLNRTIMTNVTVMIVLLILFFFGGEVIRGFIFGLIIGLLICTYSSVFIAAPLVVDLTRKKELQDESAIRPKSPRPAPVKS